MEKKPPERTRKRVKRVTQVQQKETEPEPEEESERVIKQSKTDAVVAEGEKDKWVTELVKELYNAGTTASVVVITKK